MKKKEDIEEQVRSDVTLLEENKRLKADIEALQKSGKEMGMEITSLKRANASLRGVNKSLKKEIEHLRFLNRECDELNEEKVARIDNLKKELCHCNKQRVKAEQQVLSLNAAIFQYNNITPWFKRIFKKLIV